MREGVMQGDGHGRERAAEREADRQPDLMVDADELREQVRDKSREVALSPHAGHHFHTGRRAADLMGYPKTVVDALPDRAVESFAGSATRSRCGASNQASTSSMSGRAPGLTRSSPPARSARRAASSVST